MSLLLLGATGDPAIERLAAFCRLRHEGVQVETGDWGDPLPVFFRCRAHWGGKRCATSAERCWVPWTGDYLISYRSRWIVPPAAIWATRSLALNFHPGPPEYPGFAPACFALYDQVDMFGVTCHHMSPGVDQGPVIRFDRFAVEPTDTVESVISRAHRVMEVMAYEILEDGFAGELQDNSLYGWQRTPYTRKDLEQLAILTPDMTGAEMRRRIRAVTYGPWRARMVVNRITFKEDGHGPDRADS